MPEKLEPEYETNSDARRTDAPVAEQSDSNEPAKEDREPTVKELLARLEAAEARATAAESRTVASPTPLNLVPEHAGGPGLEIAETWCQADQEASIWAARAENEA